MIFGHFLKQKKKKERKKKKHDCRKNKDRIIRDVRTIFGTTKKKEERKKKKQNEEIIKDDIIRDIRMLFEQENFFLINLSLDEYLNKIETYLRNIIIHLQDFDTWKI